MTSDVELLFCLLTIWISSFVEGLFKSFVFFFFFFLSCLFFNWFMRVLYIFQIWALCLCGFISLLYYCSIFLDLFNKVFSTPMSRKYSLVAFCFAIYIYIYNQPGIGFYVFWETESQGLSTSPLKDIQLSLTIEKTELSRLYFSVQPLPQIIFPNMDVSVFGHIIFVCCICSSFRQCHTAFVMQLCKMSWYMVK